MKIISKFRDYCDYLVGTHGEDPLLVFDRRADSGILHALPPVPAEWQAYFSDCAVEMTLHVGSRLIWLFRTPGKIHAFLDIADARPKHKG